MIAKDEPEKVLRALVSAKPYVHRAVVVVAPGDPLVGLDVSGVCYPVEIVERRWVDFGHNRTEALRLAEERGDYVLMLDADDYLLGDMQPLPISGHDAYELMVRFCELRYWRKQIFKSGAGWKYVGAVHEVAVPTKACVGQRLHLPYYIVEASSNREGKFAEHARLLEAAIAKDPNDTRSWFYLANSYFDDRRLLEAFDAYEHRIQMGGWREEVFYSLLRKAECAALMEWDWDGCLMLFERAAAHSPHRAEPLFHAAWGCWLRGDMARCAAYSRRACAIPFPEGEALFVDASVYAHKAKELLEAASARGDVAESRGDVAEAG